MALPKLFALEDCSDFSKTVEPFLPDLYALPEQLLHTLQARESFVDLYTRTNPLVSGFAFSLFLGAIFWVVSEINKNYSQVDRFWSILPTVYIAHFNVWARLAGIPSHRLDGALLFSIIWSCRLTFNYARKGGYNIGSEDYRWEIVRKNIPAWLFHLFNLTFISFIQSILLFLIAAPAYPLLLSSQFESELSTADMAYVVMELSLVLSEWFSDQQQWDYQTAKKQYQTTAKVPQGYTQAELDRGFVTRGLWAYSRHPNFAAEQSIWLVLYQWSCFATKTLYSWAAVGPSFLVLLFQGSTWLTELITSGKYPDYSDYQSQVGMFVPLGLGYRPSPPKQPKVIRTSELAKKQKK
ncbi:uncharacterized protein E0L32_007176 [Thyridium curvatum]|uniref:DUF1295 domain protein n=1 Tax=Thyridium curvatum TaxID=1093900 RepID=A0A507B4Q9_9PEZI|nr:uncharacterized protein E0L32_007176 [Thyridium curvatum]TPX12061.1 hypothetical protein E0L32_007176 [Thyridium curvatum]